MLNTEQQRKLRRIGHIFRRESLLRDTIQKRMLGKATRGRKHGYKCWATSPARTTRTWRGKLEAGKEMAINLLLRSEDRKRKKACNVGQFVSRSSSLCGSVCMALLVHTYRSFASRRKMFGVSSVDDLWYFHRDAESATFCINWMYLLAKSEDRTVKRGFTFYKPTVYI